MNRKRQISFLNPSNQSNLYYKWRVWCLILKTHSNLPVPHKFFNRDKFYDFPQIRPLEGNEIENDSELQAKLTNLTLESEKIFDLTIFALEHSDQAKTVVNSIKNKILESTSSESVLSSFYCLSDILHNSGQISKVTPYKSHIQAILPECIEFVNQTASNTRLSGKIDYLISLWEKWAVFSMRFIEGLRFTLIFNGNSALTQIAPEKREMLLEAAEKRLDVVEESNLEKECLKYGLNCSNLREFKEKFVCLTAVSLSKTGYEAVKCPSPDPELDGIPWDGEKYKYIDSI